MDSFFFFNDRDDAAGESSHLMSSNAVTPLHDIPEATRFLSRREIRSRCRACEPHFTRARVSWPRSRRRPRLFVPSPDLPRGTHRHLQGRRRSSIRYRSPRSARRLVASLLRAIAPIRRSARSQVRHAVVVLTPPDSGRRGRDPRDARARDPLQLRRVPALARAAHAEGAPVRGGPRPRRGRRHGSGPRRRRARGGGRRVRRRGPASPRGARARLRTDRGTSARVEEAKRG